MKPGDLVRPFHMHAGPMALWGLDPELHRDFNEPAGAANKEEVGLIVASKIVRGYELGPTAKTWCLVMFPGDRLGWVTEVSLESL